MKAESLRPMASTLYIIYGVTTPFIFIVKSRITTYYRNALLIKKKNILILLERIIFLQILKRIT
ncbi:MAG: hypothetical protein ABJH82_06830 [Polaribacter sp.]|uniref:hypothetical protein n=1 Tax=Polaribacter sp. TaxID=1920175 RepID=UPI0032663210